jgi:cytochrome b
VLVRLIWGFVGPKHARFDDFAYGPASAARYLRELIRFKARRYIGHSPAGALMIFLLLICLGATTVSGIAVLAIEENAGPLAPWLGPGDAMKKAMPDLSLFTAPAHASEDEEEEEEEEENESVLGEFHEFISEFTMLLIILHIAGVALASAVTRENLARAMVTGRKRAE